MSEYKASNGSVWAIEDGGHFLAATPEGYNGPPDPCPNVPVLTDNSHDAMVLLKGYIEDHVSDLQWAAARKAREALDWVDRQPVSRDFRKRMGQALSALEEAFGPRLQVEGRSEAATAQGASMSTPEIDRMVAVLKALCVCKSEAISECYPCEMRRHARAALESAK